MSYIAGNCLVTLQAGNVTSWSANGYTDAVVKDGAGGGPARIVQLISGSWIIHISGPVYDSEHPDNSVRALRDAYKSVLEVAMKHGIKELGCPPISCDKGFNAASAATAAFSVILRENKSIEKVHFFLPKRILREWVNKAREQLTDEPRRYEPRIEICSEEEKEASKVFQDSYLPRRGRYSNYSRVRTICLGKPVFAPDYEEQWVPGWQVSVGDSIAEDEWLGELILSGEVSWGCRLTDLRRPGALHPVNNKLKVTKPHLLPEPQCYESYDNPWLRGSDFPDHKPEFAQISDEDYRAVKAMFRDNPEYDEGPPGGHGFYNAKHESLYRYMLDVLF